MIKQFSINGQILNITNILTTDTIHIIEQTRSNSSGHILYSNGYYIEYGQITCTSSITTITLDKSYTTAYYCVQLQNIDTESKIITRFFTVTNRKVNSFDICANTNFTGSDGVQYITFGFIN